MYVVVLTSFGIRTIDGGFNWLHALSVLTFCALTAGLWAIWKRNIRAHRSFMTGSYFGLIGAFVGVLAVPSRRIPQLAIRELPLLGLLILVLLGHSRTHCHRHCPAPQDTVGPHHLSRPYTGGIGTKSRNKTLPCSWADKGSLTTRSSVSRSASGQERWSGSPRPVRFAHADS